MVPQVSGVAFSVDADTLIAFARSLPCGIDSPRHEPLVVADLMEADGVEPVRYWPREAYVDYLESES